MEIQTKYPSPLSLQQLLISECSFERSEDALSGIRVDTDITRKIEDLGADTYKLTLELHMNGESNKLKLAVKCIAYFQTTQDNKLLIERNALAIMFPYVRSYVSNITSQPGMMPIVLPPINIAAMFQDS